MKAGSRGLRLRIFVHERVHHEGKPLYESLVHLARQRGLAGATVFRGIEGYGLHRHLHTARLVDVSDDLPMIVELVDAEPAIRTFLQEIDGLILHGTVTLSPVEIVTYRAGRPA